MKSFLAVMWPNISGRKLEGVTIFHIWWDTEFVTLILHCLSLNGTACMSPMQACGCSSAAGIKHVSWPYLQYVAALAKGISIAFLRTVESGHRGLSFQFSRVQRSSNRLNTVFVCFRKDTKWQYLKLQILHSFSETLCTQILNKSER